MSGRSGEDSTAAVFPSIWEKGEGRRVASAAREEFFQPKDLAWLDSCDKHRDEGPGNHNFRLWMCKGMVNL
ncbi:hypothetical protein KGO5_01428 [Sinorhizobium sp. KGO-5]|jgi:hypothetical protein|uniref:Uncharacterized protein n=1 Tax=Rhizobium meliloti TaxID=382 RepID=A0A2J0Z2N0_RHIML|nr:hypothetical protein CEJ86_12990 [Sinorhizobium meliloti]GCA48991.1 hypothetical protein KGO5_01428 [Sinorhizobium sp. KGO-5]